MGFAKSQWIEGQERGWDAPDTYVCAECFEDEYLKSVVSDHASERRCDYCGREEKDPIATPLSAVVEAIAYALFAFFEEPGAAGLPRDTGEWIGEERITDTYDALLSLPLNCEEDLFDDIAKSFHNAAWYPCAKGFWLHLHKHVELRYSWEHFVHEVKYRSRFFFTSQQEGDKERHDRDDRPLELLNEIGRMAESLTLVRTVPVKTSLFRVRKAKQEFTYKTIEDMGPPPPELATAGRMNPAGISYFYLALEEKTALAEVLEKPPSRVALAFFVTKADVRILDLTQLPPMPSVFDENEAETRETLLFLDGFINAISEPITRDGREHIEYVPSQIVSEFLALVFRTEAGDQLDAVVYPSAVMPGGRNVVIFPLRDYKRQLTDLVDLTSIDDVDIQDWPDLYRRLGGKERLDFSGE